LFAIGIVSFEASAARAVEEKQISCQISDDDDVGGEADGELGEGLHWVKAEMQKN